MGWEQSRTVLLALAISIEFIEEAKALECTSAGSNDICSWTEICVPVHKSGIPPPVNPKGPPPLPGDRVSWDNDWANDNDWNWNCPGGLDIEIKRCELWVGDLGEGSRIEFTMKNHSRNRTHTSSSARWGHVGINPTAVKYPANDPGLPANPDRDPQSEFEKDYPQYMPDDSMSESLPNPIVMLPLTEKTFQHVVVTDFPPIAACGDLVYLYVLQDGETEPPYLWNRNYDCKIMPSFRRNFRACIVHRGSNKPKDTAPAKY